MKRTHKKTDCEHVITQMFKTEIGNPNDLTIRPTCAYCDINALISEPKSFLQQTFTKKEDETLALKHYKVGLIRTLSHCIFHHLADKVTTSFFCNSIATEEFDDFRTSAKYRKTGQTCGECGKDPVFP